jgi:hypothetical protein
MLLLPENLSKEWEVSIPRISLGLFYPTCPCTTCPWSRIYGQGKELYWWIWTLVSSSSFLSASLKTQELQRRMWISQKESWCQLHCYTLTTQNCYEACYTLPANLMIQESSYFPYRLFWKGKEVLSSHLGFGSLSHLLYHWSYNWCRYDQNSDVLVLHWIFSALPDTDPPPDSLLQLLILYLGKVSVRECKRPTKF